MDILTLVGIVLGIGSVLVGQYLEGGHFASLINMPALLIVLGGTVGAALLETPLSIFKRTLGIIIWVVFPKAVVRRSILNKILNWSRIARREGILGLDRAVERERDVFIKRGLQMLVDGSEPDYIRNSLMLEIETNEQRDMAAAGVFESMGGYAPTIGILGAVIGLIHVMGNLSDPDQLGAGIAVAFVATVYGVGFANLIFLPMSNKLKKVIDNNVISQMMVIEGLLAIYDGVNPKVVESKLQGFLE